MSFRSVELMLCGMETLNLMTLVSSYVAFFRSHKRRFRSYLSQNRAVLPAPSSLKLVDFLAHHKQSQPAVNLRLSKSSYSGVDTWKQRILSLPPPTETIQVRKLTVSVSIGSCKF